MSLAFLLAGYTLLSKGWRMVHGAETQLVTTGVYRYVRHPQYTGLFLMITGFLIQWPTILTVLMTPVLFAAYSKLARREEQSMMEKFGDEYRTYAAVTPGFFPPVRQWKAFLTAEVEGRYQWKSM